MAACKPEGQSLQLAGMRTVLLPDDPRFPAALRSIPRPPKRLYVLGDPEALAEGLAVVGARKATPYGIGAAKRFARLAAQRGISVISGGARGCDAAAHEAALSEGAPTVAFLGGGCDVPYPREHAGLFERIALSGGAVVSEHAWDAPALPQQFCTRNRLIAGLARATLIVEAGLPSGTFSTADEALAAGRDVLVVPGAINSASSKGANRLLVQGAAPVVDDESFSDVLFSVFGCLKMQEASELAGEGGAVPLGRFKARPRRESRGSGSDCGCAAGGAVGHGAALRACVRALRQAGCARLADGAVDDRRAGGFVRTLS